MTVEHFCGDVLQCRLTRTLRRADLDIVEEALGDQEAEEFDDGPATSSLHSREFHQHHVSLRRVPSDELADGHWTSESFRSYTFGAVFIIT